MKTRYRMYLSGLFGYLVLLAVGLLGGCGSGSPGSTAGGYAASGGASTITPSTSASANAATGYTVPVAFEPNNGQVDSSVKYVSKASGSNLYLSSNSMVFDITSRAPSKKAMLVPTDQLAVESYALKVDLVGANSSASAVGENKQVAVSHHIMGSDASAWVTDVPQYGSVKFSGVYPSIDLIYYGTQTGADKTVEHDFLVSPNGDPNAIQLAFNGSQNLSLNSNGDLVITVADGVTETFLKPVAYQMVKGVKVAVSASYVISGKSVKFAIGDYDKSLLLTIDPATLSHSTFLGGSSDDAGLAIALDTVSSYPSCQCTILAPCPVVVGYTKSYNFPTTTNAYQSTWNPNNKVAAFVTKFSPDLKTRLFSTYLEGNTSAGTSIASTVAVDGQGNVYVGGYTTATDFPTVSALQPTYPGSGSYSGFVTKLAGDGKTVAFSTYLGGSTYDYVSGLALGAPSDNCHCQQQQRHQGCNFGSWGSFFSFGWGDNQNDDNNNSACSSVYLIGVTRDTNLPGITKKSFQQKLGGTGAANTFVMRLNSDGNSIDNATYLGGEALDLGISIVLNQNTGEPFVTGQTTSTKFPVTSISAQKGFCAIGKHGHRLWGWLDLSSLGGAPVDSTNNGDGDVFVVRLSADLSQEIYGTYLGGSGDDRPCGIKLLQGTNNAVVAGSTTSSDFPVSNQGAISTHLNGSEDVFMTMLNDTGSAILVSSYLGASGVTESQNIECLAHVGNSNHDFFLAGDTTSSASSASGAFPMIDAVQGSYPTGAISTGFLTHFDINGNHNYSMSVDSNTYLGGSGSNETDILNGVVSDAAGNAWVIGVANGGAAAGASSFPTTAGASQPSSAGGGDMTVSEITKF